jgi:hypothetical protein
MLVASVRIAPPYHIFRQNGAFGPVLAEDEVRRAILHSSKHAFGLNRLDLQKKLLFLTKNQGQVQQIESFLTKKPGKFQPLEAVFLKKNCFFNKKPGASAAD